MGPIEKAIDEFREKRLKVYKADPNQIVRDARAADRAAKDHVGRWFYELFQNSDDACADEVLVLVSPNAIYVADTGKGFIPTAVEAISGTDFSDKMEGTIGRKGVGFKAVYEVSENPQLFTLSGEGLEYSREKTKGWLNQNDFKSNDDFIPYQWIPFFVSRYEIELEDSILSGLSDFNTVVKLPITAQYGVEKIKQHLDWPSHSLLTFSYVRKMEIRCTLNEESLSKVSVLPNDDVWSIKDSRLGPDPVYWRVTKRIEHPPDEILTELGSAERKRVDKDGISFMVASFQDEKHCIVPTDKFLLIRVFYPTGHTSPVRLLLHAEFLVKSDRTALIPIEDSKFNQWVSERLAELTCKFVQNTYYKEDPSKNIALLIPYSDRDSHPVTNVLWEKIVQEARKELRLGDIDGRPNLSVENAKLISVSVNKNLARRLLESTSFRTQLLHHTFDDNTEAHKALNALGCIEINDQDVIQLIEQQSGHKSDDYKWIWICWYWLADLVMNDNYSEVQTEKIESVSKLPIIPVNGQLYKATDLGGHIVTWRSDDNEQTIPEWLPLTYVDDWFRDAINKKFSKPDGPKSPFAELLKHLNITKPSTDVVQRASSFAIKQFWEDQTGDPGRFLSYIFDQNWHENTELNYNFLRCPVYARHEGSSEFKWVEARYAYFGKEWGNMLLAQLYENISNVWWVQQLNLEISLETQRSILVWLGVAERPRLIENRKKHDEEKKGFF